MTNIVQYKLIGNIYNYRMNNSATVSGTVSGTVSLSTYSSDSMDTIESFESTRTTDNNNISNSTKYKLLVPELYNNKIHGFTYDSDPNINGHFIVLHIFKKIPKNCITICNFYKKYYKNNYISLSHDLIMNYKNIITSSNYLNIEIGEIHYLRGDECVCILKTFWLKIVQRAWKKVYKIRQQIIKKRNRPDSIIYRQTTGKWPSDYQYIPSIRGMLNLLNQ